MEGLPATCRQARVVEVGKGPVNLLILNNDDKFEWLVKATLWLLW